MAQPAFSQSTVTILAHRGTSVLAPENTLPAFEFARQNGAHSLELDVRLSNDQTLFAIHDDTVDRTTNGIGRIADQSTPDLKLLDAGYRFQLDGTFPLRGTGVVLLTIDEVFAHFPDMDVNIDIKDNSPAAVDALALAVKQADANERTVVASFHEQVLNYCRSTYPWLTTSACAADVRRFLWQVLIGAHRRVHCPVSLFQLPRRHLCISFESRWFINAVHEIGGQVHFWTINDAKIMERLIRNGADGIVTDRADIATRVMAKIFEVPLNGE